MSFLLPPGRADVQFPARDIASLCRCPGSHSRVPTLSLHNKQKSHKFGAVSFLFCVIFAKHCASVLGLAMLSTLDVDSEWGASLIGVRLSIPGSWWDGFSGNVKNLATLTDFEKGESPGNLCRMMAWRTGRQRARWPSARQSRAGWPCGE